MKHLNKSLYVLIFSLIFFSCSQEDNQELQNETVNLKFETNTFNSKSNDEENSITKIETEIEFVDGLPKLISSDLVEIPVVNSENNETTYAYVLRSEYEQQQSSKNENSEAQKSSGCDISFSGGYGFTGRCFVYGTFMTGNNCNTIFMPCGFNCIGFDDVCPAWNEGFA